MAAAALCMSASAAHPATDMYQRYDDLVASVGEVPWELAAVLETAALWRATAELAYFWDVDPRAFAGRCVGESEDLGARLISDGVCASVVVGAFHFGGLASQWHVALTLWHGGEPWVLDVTADQFFRGNEAAHRLVFRRLTRNDAEYQSERCVRGFEWRPVVLGNPIRSF